MIIKAEGVVIKTMDYGETNKIITLFTKQYGKVSILVKGAKKPKSRFHSLVQMFSHGEYIFFLGKEMGTLNHGEVEQRFTDMIEDIEKTAYAAYMVELLDKMTESKVPQPHLFNQLLSSLEQINAGKDAEMIAMMFEAKLLQETGYRPQLQSCVICGNTDHLHSFSVRHGGMICNKHDEEQAVSLQAGTIKILTVFQQIDIHRLGNINIKESTKSQLRVIMRAFFDEYIGISLKTRRFLDQMKHFK